MKRVSAAAYTTLACLVSRAGERGHVSLGVITSAYMTPEHLETLAHVRELVDAKLLRVVPMDDKQELGEVLVDVTPMRRIHEMPLDKLELLTTVAFPSSGELVEAFHALPKLLAELRVLRAALAVQSSSTAA